jgi:hypothetical protein
MTQVYYCEEFEDSKRVIRIDKSKDRQHNNQKEKNRKDKPRSTNITHKTKDRITRTPLKSRVNSGGYDTSSLYYIMTEVFLLLYDTGILTLISYSELHLHINED